MINKKELLIVFIFIMVLVTYYICFTNNKSNDVFFVSYGNNIFCNVEKTKKSEKDIIKKYRDYNFVKIDQINNEQEITYDELKGIISNTSDNQFEYGISFDDKITLLSEEINSNQMIDYINDSINYNNLNEYLKLKGMDTQIFQIETLTIFTTDSKFLQDDEFVELSMQNGYNRRELNTKDLSNIINNSANLLMSMNLNNGKFIYGVRTNTGNELTSYNILRHAGSTWSLIVYYKTNPSENLKEVIENSIDYLINNYLIKYNKQIYFVEEKKTDEIKLGGNALTLLMLSEYNDVFNDNKYEEYAEKIANGIIYMQQEDGSYHHVLNLDGSLKEIYRTVYYDGEATFALLKYYSITDNAKYLDSAKKTIDMFLEKNYEKYRDHWISYAMNEFVKYNMEEKYIEFAINNYLKNKDEIDKKTSFGPVRLELLLSTYKTYIYVMKNNPQSKIVKNFDVSILENSIKINLNVLLGYYVGEEVAMYSYNPMKVMYGFHSVADDFRMRIDDIQHSLVGIINYNELFND